MKKNHSIQANKDELMAFSQAWQNEMNRYMFGGLLAPFEYGNEFGAEWIVNDLSMIPNEEVKKESKN